MATTPQQGIMALPETDEATTPQLSLNESYGAAKEGLADANPQYLAMYDDEMSKAMPALMALSDEELDLLLQLMQYLQEHPEEYKASVKELEDGGVIEKGDFPPEYDENFLSVFGAAVLEAQRTNDDTGTAAPAMQPPMQLAKGGIAEAARMVAKSGRGGDTMLAHINKKEAALLKKHGGAGTLNPRTGLREYGWNPVKAVVSAVKSVGNAVSSAVKSVGSAVKSVLNSSVGKIVATVALAAFIGPAAFGLTGAAGVAAQMGLASAGITALSGGNLKDVVKAGVTGAVAGYGGAALGPAIGGSVGVTSAAGQAALGAGLTSTGMGVATGKSISESVKAGLTSAAIAGAMNAANNQGVSRGTTTQDGSNVPVSDAVSTPTSAGQVNAQTGELITSGQTPSLNSQQGGDWLKDWQAQNAAQPIQTEGASPAVYTGQTTTAPVASSNAAFDQALANSQPVAPPMASSNQAFDQALANSKEPSFWDSTKQAYNEYLSPSGRAEAGLAEAKTTALEGYKTDIAAGVPKELAVQNYQAAIKAGTPGVMSNYGPMVATGLGATALMGGFNAEQPQPSQESMDVYTGQAARDIIDADPSKYLTQNLPGVTYDTAGNITGSGAWTPRSGAGTTEVAGNYIAYAPTQRQASLPNMLPSAAAMASPMASPLSAPIGAPAQAPSYTAPSMAYDFRPRYAAQGGFMETQGAFPANPLTMQSSPMMGMQAHELPMNTSGVAMNRPMGFANGGMPMGGIASLAVGGYPRRTGQISGPGTPTSDDIPAMLSDGEFVFTEKAVRGMGDGSRRAGAKKMYALMHRLENNAARG